VADDHGDPEQLLPSLNVAEVKAAALRDQLKAILQEALLRQVECLQRLYDVHCSIMTPEVESMSTAEKILNVRLPVELHGQLEQLVQATGRSKSFLTIEALKSYVRQEQWQIADIQAGLQEADQGEFATADEVRAVYAKYGH
jgi:predicted transcriptional regulator